MSHESTDNSTPRLIQDPQSSRRYPSKFIEQTENPTTPKIEKKTMTIQNWFRHAAKLMALAVSVWAPTATAQLPLPASTQFDITGILQDANVDFYGDALSGGSLTVNGHTIIVPRNLLVIFPANQLGWGEIFSQAPAPYAGTRQTGLALNDIPAPLGSYEVHVSGNRVDLGGGPAYIAGLVDVSQQSLNSGSGYITHIDYANAEIRVGGDLANPTTTGARVQLNDPTGRYGRAHTADGRFTVDPENPTVRSETGFPMGIPDVQADPNLPSAANPLVLNPDDALRPRTNRPLSGNPDVVQPTPPPFVITPGAPLTQWTMRDPSLAAGVLPADQTNPNFEAPFRVGDYVSYAGTLVKDGAGPTAGPMPNDPNLTYVSAHTVVASLSILTAAHTSPAYVAVDVTILGVGGVTAIGLGEAAVRTRFEGFTTDPSRTIDLFGMDVACDTGASTDRAWGSIDIDQGPPTGAVAGRWRFRPPNKILSGPASGIFLPATRMVHAIIHDDGTPILPDGAPATTGNGLTHSQYQSPIAEYLFPENVPGAPLPANNLETFPFLASGSGPLGGIAGNPIVGTLSPWPGSVLPVACGVAPVLVKPTAVTSPNITVNSGATVTIDGNGSFDPNGLPLTTFTWTSPAAITLSSTSTSVTTFTAPTVAFGSPAQTFNFTLSVASAAGVSDPATVTVTVNPQVAASTPVANAGLTQTVFANAPVTLNGAASTPVAGLTYQWTQIGGQSVPVAGVTTATPTFTAPAVAAGSSQTFTFRLVVSGSGIASAPSDTSVIVLGLVAKAPTAVATANPTAAASDSIVTLNGGASVDPNGLALTYAWAQIIGAGQPAVAPTSATSAQTTILTPHVPVGSPALVLTYQLTVANAAGLTGTTTVNVTVQPVGEFPPVIDSISPAQTVGSGALVSLTALAHDANVPVQNLTAAWTQTAGLGAIINGANTLSPNFTAPLVAAGTPAAVLTFQLKVTNAGGASTTMTTTVTVNPQADAIVITAVEYRTSKQRLTVNVTDSVVAANLLLTLKGQLNWTDTTMQNLGGGLYQVVLVGVQQPTSVTVKSALGATATVNNTSGIWRTRL